jgi:GNAT superfamily N-acetyltransferase
MTAVEAVRMATEEDIPAIVQLVRDLAEYEREPDAVELTEDALRQALFGPSPSVFAHVIDHHNGDERFVAGFALWFLNYSTWRGKHGIHLEDLYVKPELRGLGYGRALLQTLAAICVERGYGRFEWAVLDWNTPSIDFYKSHGAVAMDEWTVFRLTDGALHEFAAGKTA